MLQSLPRPSRTARHESWRLAVPLIASNLTVPALGMVDTAMAGHLDDPIYLGAVALGASVISLLYFLFGFLRMITTGITAQAYGAADLYGLAAVLQRALALAMLIGTGIILLVPFCEPVAAGFFDIEGDQRAAFQSYLLIRAFGAPAALATFVLIGWSLGNQNSRIPLGILLVSNTVNALLDVVFVIGFGMGVTGIALATVVAEYIGLALAVLLILRLWRRARLLLLSLKELLEPGELARFVRLNRDFFLRSILMEIAFISFMAMGSRLGPIALAANAILHNFFTLSAYGLDGFAHATEAMVGRAIGARNRADLRDAILAGFWNAGILAVLASLAFMAMVGPFINLLTDLEAVRAAAHDLVWAAWLLPMVSVWAFVYDGIFFGATRSAELRDGMAVSLAVFLAGSAVLVPWLGNTGLWIMFLSYLAARGLVLAWIWSRMGHKVIV